MAMIDETEKYVVQRSRLEGKVKLSGAKNSALKLLAASLLTKEPVRIINFPAALADIKIHVGMLELLGKKCSVKADEIIIEESGIIKNELIWEDRSIRNTLLILGTLVARTGYGSVPLPGGCQLGDRKSDLHEMVLEHLGARVWCENNYLHAECRKNRLTGNNIYLPIRSTGATENAILCGCLAEGVTRVWNPHVRPEIIDLIEMLRKMGACITVHGQEHIEIDGQLELDGAIHEVIPDNMEAITWLIGSVITAGDVEIERFPFAHLEVPLVFLRESGAQFFRGERSLIVRGGKCYPVDISTGPYPGINSDMQPLFAIYAFSSQGESRIIDLRFPGRFGYAAEIGKMGGEYKVEGDMLRIFGGKKLHGGKVRAIDLRAGAALVLAGLIAEGETIIEDAWQIDRGYQLFTDKIINLGGTFSQIR